ncbi:hypothetical protein ACH3XW_8100 [Acanthocheilonema viteae]
MVWSVVFQRLTASTGAIVILGSIALGAYKLRQSSDSLRGRGVYWRNQEMEDFIHCKEKILKRTDTP